MSTHCIHCTGEHARVLCAFCIEAALGAYFDEPSDAARVRAARIFPAMYDKETTVTQHLPGDDDQENYGSGSFRSTVPDLAFGFQSQVGQYPAKGPKGLSYFKGDMGDGKHVDALLYRDAQGQVIGILNHYPFDFLPHEKKGSVNVMVSEKHRRKGIGAALLREAGKRWNVDLESQTYTPSGAALANKAASPRKAGKHRPEQLGLFP